MSIDLFAEIIQDMFQLADAQGKGYVSREEFTQVLSHWSEQLQEDFLYCIYMCATFNCVVSRTWLNSSWVVCIYLEQLSLTFCLGAIETYIVLCITHSIGAHCVIMEAFLYVVDYIHEQMKVGRLLDYT